MVIQHLLLTRCGATTRSLCFVVMSCLTVPIWAQEVNSGFVDFISKGGSFLLKENGTGNGRPLKISTPVKSGDVIDVVPQTGKTTGNSFVRLLWGESFIEVKRFPYPIQTTQSGSNFFVKILLILTGHYKPVEAGSVTRGDCNPNSELKLSIPMLTEENILREGSRELYVGWYGGKSPYAVKVFRLVNGKPEKPPVVERSGIENKEDKCKEMVLKETSFKALKFQKNEQYQVVVSDNLGYTATGNFKVVPQNTPELSSATTERKCKSQPIYLYEICVASGLASQNKKLALEAYQKVAKEESFSALAVRLGLADGENKHLQAWSDELKSPK